MLEHESKYLKVYIYLFLILDVDLCIKMLWKFVSARSKQNWKLYLNVALVDITEPSKTHTNIPPSQIPKDTFAKAVQ